MPHGALLVTIGVLAAMVLTNCLKDVVGKVALEGLDVLSVTFWLRVFSFVAVATYGVTQLPTVRAPLRATAVPFGMEVLHLSNESVFTAYLLLDVVGIALAALLYYRALQIAPLSLCAPFLAFTPVLLVPMSWIILHETPTLPKLLGAMLVVIGSMLMYRQMFAVGFLAPLRAIVKEPGSRYSLLTACLFSLTNPIDKKLVLMSSPAFDAIAYGAGLVVVFAILTTWQHSPLMKTFRARPKAIVAAGLLDGIALLALLVAYRYSDIVVTISVKRTGILIAVLFGWLVFKERDIRDRLLGSGVMLLGVLVLYTPEGSSWCWVLFLTGLIIGCVSIITTKCGKVPVYGI